MNICKKIYKNDFIDLINILINQLKNTYILWRK